MAARHLEHHRGSRIGWLRAAVLGANDGIVSTASLVLGVAAAGAGVQAVLVAGVAGLVAGAMSMAAGEYVSVHSQADTERADIERERNELAHDADRELLELTAIYVGRGLAPDLAQQVAQQLTAHDALAAHVRDELGYSAALGARPMQAAVFSALSFAVGAAAPLLVVLLAPERAVTVAVAASALLALAGLGALAAWTGGASMLRGSLRISLWGAAAMAATALVGTLFGVSA
jgi:VIT1/CCC1 family predicted Fe2+/Mn2+ transporter